MSEQINAGFYLRTYQRDGKTVARLSFHCDRCSVSIVHFEDEDNASVFHCGKVHAYKAPAKKTFIESLFSPDESLPRVKAVEPMIRVLHEEETEEIYS